MSDTSKHELLKRIINEIDPIGLIDPDSSESFNEYDPEIRQILTKDIVRLSVEELRRWIFDVFVMFFSDDLVKDNEKFDLIAQRIIQELN